MIVELHGVSFMPFAVHLLPTAVELGHDVLSHAPRGQVTSHAHELLQVTD